MQTRFRRPIVYVIGETQVNDAELRRYLSNIGAEDWETDAETDSEQLIEVMGRLCYRSFGLGLNKNVTRVRNGNADYIANLNAQKHGAVLEHGTVSFIFQNVSRVLTHELVRHRVGVAISQESMRYVRANRIDMYESDVFDSCSSRVRDIVNEVCTVIEDKIQELESVLNIDVQSFTAKKRLTSFIRRIIPDGFLTTIGWTANFRTLRHVIPLRTSVHAEEEIRVVFHEVAILMKQRYSAIFADLQCNEHGEWVLETEGD